MGFFSKKKKPSKTSDEDARKLEKQKYWSDIEEQRKFVIHGGKLECTSCTNPIGQMNVTTPTASIQGKICATTNDNNGKINTVFSGQCLAFPSITKPPCQAVIQLTQWDNPSETNMNDYKGLLVRSTNNCMISGMPIKVKHSGQIEVITKIEPSVQRPEFIDAYWTDDEDTPIKRALIGDYVKLHISTKDANGKFVRLTLHDSDFGLDDQITNHEMSMRVSADETAVFRIKLQPKWGQFVKEDPGDALELYAQCYFAGFDKVEDLPKNTSDHLNVYEVGYYRDDECRIRIEESTGDVHWVPENCYTITKNKHRNMVQNPDNWTYTGNQKDLGIRNSTLVGHFAIIKDVINNKSTTDPVSMSRDGGGDPNQNDTQMKIGIVSAKSTGKQDKRYKERVMTTGGGNMRVAGAYGMLLLNATTAALEYAPPVFASLDEGKIKDHLTTLQTDIYKDVSIAIESNLIPPRYRDFTSLFYIFNVLLFGYNKEAESELFNVGKEIYRNISMYKKS